MSSLKEAADAAVDRTRRFAIETGVAREEYYAQTAFSARVEAWLTAALSAAFAGELVHDPDWLCVYAQCQADAFAHTLYEYEKFEKEVERLLVVDGQRVRLQSVRLADGRPLWNTKMKFENYDPIGPEYVPRRKWLPAASASDAKWILRFSVGVPPAPFPLLH